LHTRSSSIKQNNDKGVEKTFTDHKLINWYKHKVSRRH